MKRLFAIGAAVTVVTAVGALPQSAFATQALQNGQKISTTSSKLLTKTGTLTGSQQNILICDPPGTPVNGSTSVDYDGEFNVHLQDIVAGPGYQVDYNRSWIQFQTNFGEETLLKQNPIGKAFVPDDQPGVYYQKLSAYLSSGGFVPSPLVETGYIQIFFTQTGAPVGAFNTGGEYTGAFTGNTYDLSQYGVVDTDGIQPAGTLTAGGKDATIEYDNYFAVFDTFTEDPLTYTHYSNPNGPGGEDLLTDPVTGQTYGTVPGGEGKGTVVPSTVSTNAPEPASAALILFAGAALAARRRRA